MQLRAIIAASRLHRSSGLQRTQAVRMTIQENIAFPLVYWKSGITLISFRLLRP